MAGHRADAQTSGMHVYVIDDEPAVLASTGFLLRTLGHECQAFAAAEDFLAAAAALAPGCILTDLRMPGMDGLALAEALRERAIDWPAVLMTSDDSPDIEQAARDRGFSSVLRKPLEEPLLIDAIAAAFAALRD
jgi:two-component system response regulator FixJ